MWWYVASDLIPASPSPSISSGSNFTRTHFMIQCLQMFSLITFPMSCENIMITMQSHTTITYIDDYDWIMQVFHVTVCCSWCCPNRHETWMSWMFRWIKLQSVLIGQEWIMVQIQLYKIYKSHKMYQIYSLETHRCPNVHRMMTSFNHQVSNESWCYLVVITHSKHV